MESKTPSRYTEERLDIHPTASRFQIMLDKVKHHAKKSMNDTFDYAKQKWDKGHKVPDFKVERPFVIVALHVANAVQVELSGELENTHPTFPVSLIKHYHPADRELFPSRNSNLPTVPPVEQNEDKKIKKLIK
ncbi:hypothetical protein O181_048327 [Austropuccinia psidii MF-1]|uniref:Uncharacterized protein n=1 Tax=Austropuccinia psidii MF-1 TaxID=1389203 RepID=A0A9Q3DUX3_9BASI|nr:hypothetical protein [Austropuccinia psidii MF-1]